MNPPRQFLGTWWGDGWKLDDFARFYLGYDESISNSVGTMTFMHVMEISHPKASSKETENTKKSEKDSVIPLLLNNPIVWSQMCDFISCIPYIHQGQDGAPVAS